MALIAASPQPEMPVLSAQTRLLVVAPHPDDETIATGLLIQQVRAAGGEVRILLLTAGDNNPWPQRWLERRLWIGAAERRRWGQRRQQEMLQALQCLGVPATALQSLGWPDLGLTGFALGHADPSVSVVAQAIGQFRPSLIALPALHDQHPDHGSAHVLLRLALARSVSSPQLLTYLVHGRARGAEAIEIDGTLAQRAGKYAALAAHRSQMALSGKRMRRLAGGAERYQQLESVQPFAILPWQPPFWLQPWLRLSVVSQAGAQTWHWRDAPVHHDEGGFRLDARAAGAGPVRFARLALNLPTPWIFDHWGWCELG